MHDARYTKDTKQSRIARKAHETMRRIALQIVQDKKAIILSGKVQPNADGTVKDISDTSGRDLISVLIKANLGTLRRCCAKQRH